MNNEINKKELEKWSKSNTVLGTKFVYETVLKSISSKELESVSVTGLKSVSSNLSSQVLKQINENIFETNTRNPNEILQ